MRWTRVFVLLPLLILLSANLAVASTTFSLGFVSQGGNFTAFSYPGAAATDARAINNLGHVAGNYFDGTASHGFIKNGGTFSSFDLPGFYGVFGMNDLDQVVGASNDGSHYHGFMQDGGTTLLIDYPGALETVLTGINDSGLIVGNYLNGSRWSGFTLSGNTFTSLSYGVFSTFVDGVNNVGDVMGTFDNHGFVLNGASFMSFDFPTTIGSYDPLGLPAPSGINDNGKIVGSFLSGGSSGNVFHGFVKDGNTYSSFDFPDPSAQVLGTYAFGINNGDQIVGRVEFIPEAPTLLLLAAGLGGIFMGSNWRVTFRRKTPQNSSGLSD